MKTNKLIESLEAILANIERHYKEPMIAPNGKAEGLCLSVRGLKGIIKQLESTPKK